MVAMTAITAASFFLLLPAATLAVAPLPNRMCTLPVSTTDIKACGYIPLEPGLGPGPWTTCSGVVDTPVVCDGVDYTNQVGDALYFAPIIDIVIGNGPVSCPEPAKTARSDTAGNQLQIIAAGSASVHTDYDPATRVAGGDDALVLVDALFPYGDPNDAGTATGDTLIEVLAWIDPYANFLACQIRAINTLSTTPPTISCTC